VQSHCARESFELEDHVPIRAACSQTEPTSQKKATLNALVTVTSNAENRVVSKGAICSHY
jgi:hypothetical protein